MSILLKCIYTLDEDYPGGYFSFYLFALEKKITTNKVNYGYFCSVAKIASFSEFQRGENICSSSIVKPERQNMGI